MTTKPHPLVIHHHLIQECLTLIHPKVLSYPVEPKPTYFYKGVECIPQCFLSSYNSSVKTGFSVVTEMDTFVVRIEPSVTLLVLCYLAVILSCDFCLSTAHLWYCPPGASRKDQPSFTLKQVSYLCERLLKDHEEKIREEYEQILNTKLAGNQKRELMTASVLVSMETCDLLIVPGTDKHHKGCTIIQGF